MIAVCSILILSVAIFFWYRNITIHNVNKANQSVLRNTETVYNNYKDIVQNYTMDFFANPNINALMMSGDTDWSDQLYSALSQIKGALIVNPYLENAYIFGSEAPVAMFENLPLNAESKNDLFRRIRSSRIVESPFLWQAAQNNGSPIRLMTVFYNDRAFENSAYYGGVAITVNLSKLQKNLFSQQEEEASSHYKILDDRGELLMHSPGGSSLDSEMARQILDSPTEEGSFVFRGSGEAQLITYVHSERDKMWFVSETAYSDSVRDISNARNLMMILCLLLALAAALSSYLLSRRIYQPIHRIFGSIAHISGGGQTLAGDDYNVVNRELETIGQRMAQLRQENHDSALMRWLLAPREAAASNGPHPHLTALEGAYWVCLLSMQGSGEEVDRGCEERLERIALEFAEWAEVRTFRPHRHAAVLIVSERRPGCFDDYAGLRGRWESIEQSIIDDGATHSMGISSLSDDALLLKDKYEEACECLRCAKFHERRRIIFADDVIHLNASPIPASSMEPVLTAVRQQDRDHLRQAIERLLAVTCSYRLEPATALLANLVGELSRTADMPSGKNNPGQAGLLDFYQQIDRAESFTELRQVLETQSLAAINRLSQMGGVQTHSLAAQAIDYIGVHYDDPKLSLNGLAEMLGISPAYLSRLIAEGTGSTFPELVNLHRLERAESLLVGELELDIREIAERVGYNSSTYFTTQFKKRYGVTPSKWRINHVLQHKPS